VDSIIQQTLQEGGPGDWTKVGILFSLFIIWKLIEELIRYRGMKSHKKFNGSMSYKPCKWVEDDHKWLSENRDDIREIKQMIKNLTKEFK